MLHIQLSAWLLHCLCLVHLFSFVMYNAAVTDDVGDVTYSNRIRFCYCQIDYSRICMIQARTQDLKIDIKSNSTDTILKH